MSDEDEFFEWEASDAQWLKARHVCRHCEGCAAYRWFRHEDRFCPACLLKIGKCENCGSCENVAIIPAMTAYGGYAEKTRWDALLEREPPDPNPEQVLCGDCATEYKEYWDEMWREYYASR